jgi:hypothetical protein
VTTLAVPEDDDLFTPAEAPPEYGVRAGRYRFPAPPGYTGDSWMRMTNLASAFSDQERLQLWLEWKAMMGLRANDGLLYDEWMAEAVDHLAPEEQKKLANRYAELARGAAGADAAGRRGTARHNMMDHYFTTDVVTGTRSMRMQLASAVEALDRCGLDVVETEFKVWHPIAGGTMGTSDAKVLCRRTGRLGTLDWKTQARFWTWQEIAGQLYGYDSAPFAWAGPHDSRGHWVENVPNTLTGHPDGLLPGRRVALVAHMPISGAPVEIHEVSMQYGRQVLECAAENVRLRSVGRSTSEKGRPSGLRPPL